MQDAPTIAVQIQREWHQLADVVRLAEYALQPRRGLGEIVRGKPESRPPINMSASALLALVDTEVDFYVHVLIDETEYVPPLGREARVRSVANRAGHFLSDEDRAGLDMLDTAQTLISRILGIAMPTPPPSWAGPCETPGCDGDTWRKDRGAVTCDACESRVDLETWRRKLLPMLGMRLQTRSEIARSLDLLGVKVGLDAVHKWAQRGRIKPVPGVSADGDNLYRMSEVLDYARTTPKGRASTVLTAVDEVA